MPLSVQLFVLFYAVSTGFVASGLVGSFYQLVTTHPPRFALLGSSAPAMFLTFLFCAVTGPFIIMRNALELLKRERSALGWLAGSAVIAAMWSACSGLLLLEVVLVG